MKTVIIGCGRVGAELAEAFDQAGHDVIIIDTSTRAFDRLPANFGGSAVRGDGTDEDALRRAGAEDADVFLAMTEGDNRNVMAAQLAVEALRARRVVAKVNDPLRAAAYADLGLATLCRTTLMGDAVASYLGMPTSGRAGVYAPSGKHPGGEHHELPGPVDGAMPGSTLAPSAAQPSATAERSASADRSAAPRSRET